MGESVPEKNFLLMRREPDRSIFQAVSSNTYFFQKSRNSPGPTRPARPGPAQEEECLQGPTFLKTFNGVLNVLFGVPKSSKIVKLCIPGHANLAECQEGVQKWRPFFGRIL